MSGSETKINCDEVVREDSEYRKTDLTDFIKSARKEIDDDFSKIAMMKSKIYEVTNTLIHDLDIIERKISQANWLTADKRQFLEGQKKVITVD